MNTDSVNQTPPPAQVERANGTPVLPPAAPLSSTRRCYRDLAAAALYHMVRPIGGLRWEVLTLGQQQEYRDLIDAAALATAKGGES